MNRLKEIKYFEDTQSIEATWIDENDVIVKCHSYANSQMNDLASDLGDDRAQYAELLETVAATVVPVIPPTPEEIAKAEAHAKKEVFMEAWEKLTVTFEGNKYACKKSSMTSMQVIIGTTNPGAVIRWYEDWDNFDTTPEVLGQVLQLAIIEKEKMEQGVLNG